MCLSTVDFALDKNGIGEGYKVLPIAYFDSLLRLKPVAKNNGWSKTWQKAKAIGFIKTNQYEEYYPGFHIFTKLEDALNYNLLQQYYVLVKVNYRNVTAFGQNSTANNNGRGPCVIAEEMKIKEVLGNAEEYWKKHVKK